MVSTKKNKYRASALRSTATSHLGGCQGPGQFIRSIWFSHGCERLRVPVALLDIARRARYVDGSRTCCMKGNEPGIRRWDDNAVNVVCIESDMTLEVSWNFVVDTVTMPHLVSIRCSFSILMISQPPKEVSTSERYRSQLKPKFVKKLVWRSGCCKRVHRAVQNFQANLFCFGSRRPGPLELGAMRIQSEVVMATFATAAGESEMSPLYCPTKIA